ncbi:MAG: aminoacyl--tRNA ligase-related protein [Conexivisphaera sp.]
MKFTGDAVYRFNRELPREILESVQAFVDGINGSVLGGSDARVTSHSASGDVLRLGLETGRRLKPHNAALRIRNHIEATWGRAHRLGVREVALENLVVELDREYRVSLKLPYVSGISSEGGRTHVSLVRLSESEMKKPVLDRLLKLLEDKEARAAWGGKAEHWIQIARSAEKEPRYLEDPNKVLESSGLIKRFSVGQWVYTPTFYALLRPLADLFVDEVVRPLGFREAMFPKMYPLEVGLKTGHLKGTVNSMLFATFPRSYDISEFEDVIDYMSVTDEIPVEDLAKRLEPPNSFLCYAQCEPFYWFFGGEVIDDGGLPVKWFDRSGPSYRWEAGGIYGIERMVEFHRAEVVWMGRTEQAVEIRNQLLEGYRRFMDEILDLEWRWAWVTPFYLEQSGEVESEGGEAVDVNQPGTIDFEAWLPYRGDRGDRRSWLEIGNISIHGTKYTKPFRVKHNRGETLWTGCSGFGTERWLLALLSQKGLDPSNWPPKYRERVAELGIPEPVREVTYPRGEEGRRELEQLVRMFSSAGLLERGLRGS